MNLPWELNVIGARAKLKGRFRLLKRRKQVTYLINIWGETTPQLENQKPGSECCLELVAVDQPLNILALCNEV